MKRKPKTEAAKKREARENFDRARDYHLLFLERDNIKTRRDLLDEAWRAGRCQGYAMAKRGIRP